MPRPLDQLLGREDLGSDPNQRFIDQAIQRKLAAQSPQREAFRQKVREAKKKRRRPRKSHADLATELFTDDLITGRGEAAGEGIIPYASMPMEIRKQIPIDAPPIGWDIRKLPARKRHLLLRLKAIGDQERAAAAAQALPGPMQP